MVKKSIFKYDFVQDFLTNNGGQLAMPLIAKYYLTRHRAKTGLTVPLQWESREPYWQARYPRACRHLIAETRTCPYRKTKA